MGDNDNELLEVAREIGYPVIIKASGGGGGRGMRVVHSESALLKTISLTRSEAGVAFGDDGLYMEKYLEQPRHIEIQVLADEHGNVIHLGSVTVPYSAAIKRLLRKRRPRALMTPPGGKSVSVAFMCVVKLLTAARVRLSFYMKTASSILLK